MDRLPVQIGYLADHPDFILELARWHHQEWAYLRPGDSVEARCARLTDACGRNQVPTTLIALSDSELLGSAMLVAHDMDTRMDMSPWLAGVFVAPSHRRQGIGRALVWRGLEEARNLGLRRLYLYTPNSEGFYSNLGWLAIERTTYRDVNVVIMSYDI